ncbi:cyclase family protein [Hyalangium versicolor]|uniref:cyclase family protein n=1 Tax=Hyalangium versicolor TaxID=2861190 RepID=UPI001CCB4E8E|nr:cyclase family protein [Hyalangium versicolor]
MKRFIELNHPIQDGMTPYPGLSSPKVKAIVDHAASRPRYQNRSEFYLGRLEMDCNTGTYLDSPFHRYPDTQDIGNIPLEQVAGLPGHVVSAEMSASRSVNPQLPEGDLRGRAILVKTSWDERWATERYYEPGPFLAPEFVDRILQARPALVGVDCWNVDDTQDPARPVHTRLLAAGILIVEHLCNLQSLPPDGFRFYAVPLRVVGAATMPVRAFAEHDV